MGISQFSLKNVGYLSEYTKVFSLQFEQSTACTQLKQKGRWGTTITRIIQGVNKQRL